MAVGHRWRSREAYTCGPRSRSALIFTWFAAATTVCLAAWQENVRPKMYVQLGE
nr:unnamed protein product [Callosobruchus chinensis]